MAEQTPYPGVVKIKGQQNMPKGAPASATIGGATFKDPGNAKTSVPSAYPGTVNQPLKSDNQKPASRSRK